MYISLTSHGVPKSTARADLFMKGNAEIYSHETQLNFVGTYFKRSRFLVILNNLSIILV